MTKLNNSEIDLLIVQSTCDACDYDVIIEKFEKSRSWLLVIIANPEKKTSVTSESSAYHVFILIFIIYSLANSFSLILVALF